MLKPNSRHFGVLQIALLVAVSLSAFFILMLAFVFTLDTNKIVLSAPISNIQPQTIPLDNLFSAKENNNTYGIYGVIKGQTTKLTDIKVQNNNIQRLFTSLSPDGWYVLYYTFETNLGGMELNLIDLKKGEVRSSIIKALPGNGIALPVWKNNSSGFGYLVTTSSISYPFYSGTLSNYEINSNEIKTIFNENIIEIIGFSNNDSIIYFLDSNESGILHYASLDLTVSNATSKIILLTQENGITLRNFRLGSQGSIKTLAYSVAQTNKPDTTDFIRLANPDTGATLQEFEAGGNVSALMVSTYLAYNLDSVTAKKSPTINPLSNNNGLWMGRIVNPFTAQMIEKQQGTLDERFELLNWNRDGYSLLIGNTKGDIKQVVLSNADTIILHKAPTPPAFSIPSPMAVVKNLSVPYVHQNLDTADGFDGSWACGPTSAVMTLAAYAKITPHPMHINYSNRDNAWGWYVSNIYTNNGTTFNTMQTDPRGRAAYGAYGWSVAPYNGVCCTAWAWRMQDYMTKNGLSSTFSNSPSFSNVSSAISQGKIVILSTYLTSGGHIVVVKGYTDNGSLIVNDPWGNKNQTGYGNYANGADVSYTWAELSASWMIVIDNPIPAATPEGDINSADCNSIIGWAWDPKAPNVPINVHVYFNGVSGVGQGYATTANIYRSDVATLVSHDNGLHGFSFAVPDVYKGGLTHEVRVYAINTDPNGGNPEIGSSPKAITCQPNSEFTGNSANWLADANGYSIYMIPGQTQGYSITTKNTGAAIWSDIGVNPPLYRLGVHNTIAGYGRSFLNAGEQVGSGGTKDWPITLTVPTNQAAGTYTDVLQMVNETITWFGPTKNLQVTVLPPLENNIARGKTITASSIYSAGNEASKVADADPNSRWASQDGAINPTLTVDLGSNYRLDRLKIYWARAYSKNYTVQILGMNGTWQDVFVVADGTSGLRTLTFPAGTTASKVQIVAQPADIPHVSIWELEVFGTREFGVGEGSGYSQNYVEAFNRIGGSTTIGSTTGGVSWFGTNTGVTWQPFTGGNAGSAGIFHHEAGGAPPSTIRAFVVMGVVFSTYMNMGGPSSALGLPTSDEFVNASGNPQSNFANGYITWNGSSYQAYYWPNTFTGWKAQYYNNANLLSAPSLVRNEVSAGGSTGLDFKYDWPTWYAPMPTLGLTFSTNWSASWDRTYTFTSGRYQFMLCGDDGVRLYLSGAKVIDQWKVQNKTCYYYSQTYSTQTAVPIRIEYYQGDGGTAIEFGVTALPLRSIAVTPANSSIVKGTTQQFTAIGTYSDNSTATVTNSVTWSSSDTSKATISASGLATGVNAGSATITALLNGISSSTALTVYSGLTTTVVSGSLITLSWGDVSGETGYKIERKVGTGGPYSQIGTTGANVTTFNDTNGLFPAIVYYYRVRSYNASGNSAYSNEASAITPGTAVSVTTGLALATQVTGSIPVGGLTINLPSTITLTGPLTIPSGVFINGGNCGSGAKTMNTAGYDVQMRGGALLSNLNITGGKLKITGGGVANPVTAICTVVKRA